MKDWLMKILTVKSLVTFALIGVTCVLAIMSELKLSSEFFASIVTAVITYYFTRKDSNAE